MAQQLINLGTTAGDGTGESPFTGMQKVNDNFTELYNLMTAANAAIALKAPIANPTFTGTVGGITKAMVGLGNVDNTPDTSKPVSTVQQTAINAGDKQRLKVDDVFEDFVASGLVTPTSANLLAVTSAGTAYVNGQRVVKTVGDSDLTHTYLATRDTYVDIDSAGVISRTAVVNGAAAPSLASGSLRLEKVVTDGTKVASVVSIATRIAKGSLVHTQTNASGAVAILGPNGTPIWWTDAIDPRSYGAKCDGKMVLDATISTGTTTVTVTSASGLFVANDVGKTCAVLTTSTTGPWDSRPGTVTGFTSTTQITVSLSGSSGALTNAQFVWGTDDTAAWSAAATAAGNQKRPLFVPVGISCVQNFTLPDRIPMFGMGADRTPTWPWQFAGHGSTIICTKWPGDDATPVIQCGYGNALTGFNIDAFKTAGFALRSDTNNGHGKWANMTIARGYSGVCITGPAHSIANCTIWGQASAGTNGGVVGLSGDNRISDCDIYGAATNGAAVYCSGHDVVVQNNHFWKNSTTVEAGPSVSYRPSVTSGVTGNFLCTGNMFDTSNGPHVNVEIQGTAIAHSVNIRNNDGFQNDLVPDATYPYVKLTVASGAVIRGLTVADNTGMSAWNDPAQAQYTYLVDGSAVAGNIYGSRTGGNVVSGCAALYKYSATWTAWDHNGGDIVVPYPGTTVTKSTTT